MLHRSILNLALAIIPTTRFFAFKRLLCGLAGINVGMGTSICGTVKFYGKGEINIGSDCWIGIGSIFYISNNSSLIIESNVDVAPNVIFHSGTHKIGGSDRRAGVGESKSIKVGRGSWIGLRSILLAGAVIPPGCVVAAGSTVTDKKTPVNSLIGGTPANVIKEIL